MSASPAAILASTEAVSADDLGGVARRLRHPARQSRGLGDALKSRDGRHRPRDAPFPARPLIRRVAIRTRARARSAAGPRQSPRPAAVELQLLIRPVKVVGETEQSLRRRSRRTRRPTTRRGRASAVIPAAAPVPLEPGGGRLLDDPVVPRGRGQRASEVSQLGGCRIGPPRRGLPPSRRRRRAVRDPGSAAVITPSAGASASATSARTERWVAKERPASGQDVRLHVQLGHGADSRAASIAGGERVSTGQGAVHRSGLGLAAGGAGRLRWASPRGAPRPGARRRTRRGAPADAGRSPGTPDRRRAADEGAGDAEAASAAPAACQTGGSCGLSRSR